jgi:hypothetical protein
MRTPNESWMELHRLAAAIDSLGLTRQERHDNLLAEFFEMPPLVRRELLRELQFLLAELPDLEPVIASVVNEAETVRPRISGRIA